VRDATAHKRTFSYGDAPYLRHSERGLAGGDFWPCDFGPDLSRGFRALKVWFAFKAYGASAMGESIAATCRAARALGARIDAEPELERLAPVALNIVCFRFKGSDALNAEIVVRLQEAGLFVPSTTTLSGRLCIRAAIVNHRTTTGDALALADEVLRLGRALAASGEFA
jgi:aromatic-L-amino-acid decarboxylase